MITAQNLSAAFGLNLAHATDIVDDLNQAMADWEIDTPIQQAQFLAQCAHESGKFKFTVENLNYSTDGLRRVFPRHFRTVDASKFHRQPEKIANHVYANRMGNGPASSGDGWKFRGRGYIQLTGRSNYAACARDIEVDIVTDPSYLETSEGAAQSAAWFWYQNSLNDIAHDTRATSIRINGGTNGLDDRINLFNRARRVIT